jgi:hyperosmotically inducible periplasmic protein
VGVAPVVASGAEPAGGRSSHAAEARDAGSIETRSAPAADRLEETADRVEERADRAPARRAPAPPESQADARGSVERVGTKGDRGLADALVTARVKTALVGEEALEGSDINVDTDSRGAVTLAGRVPSEAARKRAIDVAKTVEGVNRVEDTLKVKP